MPRSYIGEILDDELFETLIDPGKVKAVLDLCTGSGCLAILAAMRFPKAKVDAADLSKDALAVAKKNVALHRMQRRVRLAQGDLFAPLAGKRYDLIVSNPPYVDAKGMRGLPPECRHEPALAFDGGKDGIAIVRRIIERGGPPSHARRRAALRGRPLPACAGARLSAHAVSLARHRSEQRRGVLARC